MKKLFIQLQRKIFVTIAASILLVSSSFSFAGTVTNTITPNLTFLGFCLMSVTDINFGQLPAGATNVSANGTLSVLCTRTTSYNAYIDYAEYPTPSRLVGQVKGDIISYGIVNPQNGSGFETSGRYTNPIVDTATGFTKDYTLKAVIANVGYVSPDTYKATVNVIVSY